MPWTLKNSAVSLSSISAFRMSKQMNYMSNVRVRAEQFGHVIPCSVERINKSSQVCTLSGGLSLQLSIVLNACSPAPANVKPRVRMCFV